MIFAKYSHSPYIQHPAEGPLEFCNGSQAQKTRMMPLPECEKSVMIYSFIKTQYWHWTDKRTDGRIKLEKQYHAMHALNADMR